MSKPIESIKVLTSMKPSVSERLSKKPDGISNFITEAAEKAGEVILTIVLIEGLRFLSDETAPDPANLVYRDANGLPVITADNPSLISVADQLNNHLRDLLTPEKT
jgi:hypothetical protein